jgi:general secretion pathway protein G
MKLNVRLSYLQVVVIAAALAILSRLTVPQSSQAGIEDKTAELIEALVQMRTGIDLYRAEHDGRLPSASCGNEFEKVLTHKVGRYGPYIKRIPDNPFNGLDTIRFDGEPAGANTAGWRLDTKAGVFQADNAPEYSAL